VTDQVAYGDYGGSNFDRDGLSVASRSDTALVMSFSYSTDGEVETTTDPRGLVARTERDDAGRTTKEIRNYSAGVNSGNPANPDDNQTVRYEYVDGLRTKIIADVPSGETDQETVYIHGTTAGTPSAQVLSTGHLLRATKYPDSTNTGTSSANIDSDSSDVVSHAYNAQGQEVYRKDQAGSVFETEYDTSGRQTQRRVTTLAAGFDGAVRRQSRTYDGLGRPSFVTQYDNATVGSGAVTDEVSYAYDGWGGVTSYKQDRDSAVGASGYYEVAYAYAKATTGRNTVRRSQMTLPGGLAIHEGQGRVHQPPLAPQEGRDGAHECSASVPQLRLVLASSAPRAGHRGMKHRQLGRTRRRHGGRLRIGALSPLASLTGDFASTPYCCQGALGLPEHDP
jgi:YD repeat-containing protein